MTDQRLQYACRLRTSPNARALTWQGRAARIKAERRQARDRCKLQLRTPELPCLVILTYVCPRKLDEVNLLGSLKATQDGVAEWLGVNDGDETQARWKFEQERGAYAVRVEIAAIQAGGRE